MHGNEINQFSELAHDPSHKKAAAKTLHAHTAHLSVPQLFALELGFYNHTVQVRS